MNILKVDNIKKYYGKNNNLVKAVDDVSFSVEKGDRIAIIGKSGSGKSSILNCIASLDEVSEGTVFYKDKRIEAYDKEIAATRRREFGFVFQNFNLIPFLSVIDNIMLPIELDKSEVDKEYIEEIIVDVG